MNFEQKVLTIVIVVIGTMLTRFFPFIIFRNSRTTPKYIRYLGKVLPPAILGFLLVYCLRDVPFISDSYGIPELLSIVLIIIVHYWKKSMLLSISIGTVFFLIIKNLYLF